MDHAYLPIRCPEINEDRIFVKRQIVFPSERFADCLRSRQDSRVGRYRTFVSGILPHDLHAAFIDVVERKDLSADDAQQTQGKFVFVGQISTLVAVWSFFQLFLQPFGFFTPETEAAGKFGFFGGKRYAYTITVKANGIDVQSVTSGTWVANGEENVTSKRVKQRFTADELKIGDYFYSDGTWSDGGLRKIYADGSMHIDYYKPVPLRGKTVVGIVFQTDKSRIGKKEKEKLGGENKAHGLVMAVKNANAAEKVIWSNESRYLDLLNDCVSKSNNYSDISGYGNCESIRSLEGNFDKYPALQAVDGYNTTCPVPTTTTGWYLPSSGQWWDILQNLGGCPALADGYQQTSSDINEFFWSNQGNVPDALNKWMWGIDGWDKFSYYHQFWSSSKFKGNTMRYWVANSDDGWISCRWGNVNFQLYVRPVLAF